MLDFVSTFESVFGRYHYKYANNIDLTVVITLRTKNVGYRCRTSEII